MKQSSSKAITSSNAPTPVGPYSQAILAGEWIYCSGQIALDPKTGKMVGNGNVIAETQQVLLNLVSVLEAAGASSADVVKTTIYLKDLSDFEKVNNIYASTFKNAVTPARACVEVAELPKGGKVEIDCVAWIGGA